jgi:hypothetical protein
MGLIWEKLLTAAAVPSLTRTYTGTGQSLTNSSSYSFSSTAIGTAAADRNIVVLCTVQNNDAIQPSTCTVGGAATTRVATRQNTEGAAIFVTNAYVTSGTTATIAITTSVGSGKCRVFVYAVYGNMNRTPIATLNSTANDPSGSLDLQAGGVAFGVGQSRNLTTHSWTGLTEDADLQQDEGTDMTSSCASIEATATETITVQCDMASSNNDRLLAASFAPA